MFFFQECLGEMGFGDSPKVKTTPRLKERLQKYLHIIYQQSLHIDNEI